LDRSKRKDYTNFKELAGDETPDISMQSTPACRPKALVFPQSEDHAGILIGRSRDDHHIMKEVAKDYSPRAVVGIRPCDAKAMGLVHLNFDTPD
jgi:sulfhydrogenase subunit beta (sulfur reductase)